MIQQAGRSLPGPPPDLNHVVAEASRRAGVQLGRFRLLRHFATAVYLVEDVPVVVRVAYGAGSVERSGRAVKVARWLTAQHLPVTEPATIPSGAGQPIAIEGHGEVAVTFWRYYPQPARLPAPDPEALARIARALHDIRSPSPIPLPSYKPLRSIRRAVNDSVAAERPGEQHIAWLLQWLAQRIGELLSEYQTLSFPLGTGIIHGDMHTGNLLLSSGEYPAVLGDWDSVSVGPREIDLAPTFSAPRFGLDPRCVDQFVAAYGYDLREWPGYPTLRAMRELSTLTALVRLAPTEAAAARELEHRLSSLWRGDTTVVWTRQ